MSISNLKCWIYLLIVTFVCTCASLRSINGTTVTEQFNKYTQRVVRRAATTPPRLAVYGKTHIQQPRTTIRPTRPATQLVRTIQTKPSPAVKPPIKSTKSTGPITRTVSAKAPLQPVRITTKPTPGTTKPPIKATKPTRPAQPTKPAQRTVHRPQPKRPQPRIPAAASTRTKAKAKTKATVPNIPAPTTVGGVPFTKPVMFLHISHGGGIYMTNLAKANGERAVSYLYGDGPQHSIRRDCTTRMAQQMDKRNVTTFYVMERPLLDGEYCPHLFRYMLYMRDPMEVLRSILTDRDYHPPDQVATLLGYFHAPPRSELEPGLYRNEFVPERGSVFNDGRGGYGLRRLDNIFIRSILANSSAVYGPLNRTIGEQELHMAKQRLAQFDVVFTSHDFLKTPKRVREYLSNSSRLHWKQVVRSADKTSSNQHGHVKHQISGDIWQQLRHVNRFDIELYAYAKQLFNVSLEEVSLYSRSRVGARNSSDADNGTTIRDTAVRGVISQIIYNDDDNRTTLTEPLASATQATSYSQEVSRTTVPATPPTSLATTTSLTSSVVLPGRALTQRTTATATTKSVMFTSRNGIKMKRPRPTTATETAAAAAGKVPLVPSIGTATHSIRPVLPPVPTAMDGAPFKKPVMFLHISHGGGTYMTLLARFNGERVLSYIDGDGPQHSIRRDCTARMAQQMDKRNVTTFYVMERPLLDGEYCPHLFRYMLYMRDPMEVLRSILTDRDYHPPDQVATLLGYFHAPPRSELEPGLYRNEFVPERGSVFNDGRGGYGLRRLDNIFIRSILANSSAVYGPLNRTIGEQELHMAKQRLAQFDVVFTSHDFLKTPKRVREYLSNSSRLHWKQVVRSTDKTSSNQHGHVKHQISGDIWQQLRHVNRFDLELYEYAKHLFNTSMQ